LGSDRTRFQADFQSSDPVEHGYAGSAKYAAMFDSPDAMISPPRITCSTFMQQFPVDGDRVAAAIVTFSPISTGGRHCFGSDGMASEARSGREGVSAGTAPRSSEAATQSPAHNLAPLTVPTSMQPIGSFGFA
jgi:hypothetical protein